MIELVRADVGDVRLLTVGVLGPQLGRCGEVISSSATDDKKHHRAVSGDSVSKSVNSW